VEKSLRQEGGIRVQIIVSLTPWKANPSFRGQFLFPLIGYRNRLLVLINWVRHYLFREHAACRILPSEPAPPSAAETSSSGQEITKEDEESGPV
jgi:hypothetical protein